MAVNEKGYTDYKPAYDIKSAAQRRLDVIAQNEAMGDAYTGFKSQLKTNQNAFDEGIAMRQAGLKSLSVGSRNADSMSQYGADLLGRVQRQFSYVPQYSGPASRGANTGASLGTGNVGPVPAGEFGAFSRAIGTKESGNNYSAVNQHSGALGKYQIMPFNISQWSREALGYQISPSQFLSSPQYQEQIAQYHLRGYYDKYGPAGAAVAWYAGPSAAQNFVNSGYASRGTEANGYPSVYSYVGSIMSTMRSYL